MCVATATGREQGQSKIGVVQSQQGSRLHHGAEDDARDPASLFPVYFSLAVTARLEPDLHSLPAAVPTPLQVWTQLGATRWNWQPLWVPSSAGLFQDDPWPIALSCRKSKWDSSSAIAVHGINCSVLGPLLCSTGIFCTAASGVTVVTVHLQFLLPCSDAGSAGKCCLLLFILHSNFFLSSPVGLNSHFRSFLWPGVPRLFCFSSSCCCIPAFGRQISERLFCCCSPLCHIPRSHLLIYLNASFSHFQYYAFNFLLHFVLLKVQLYT